MTFFLRALGVLLACIIKSAQGARVLFADASVSENPPTGIAGNSHDTPIEDVGRQWWWSAYEQHSWCYNSAFALFAVLAWCTFLQEIWLMRVNDSVALENGTMKPRELLWDISKFWLMCLVWMCHNHLPGRRSYDGWFMPAFFFLSGLMSSAPSSFDLPCFKKFAVRVLRDNFLNVALFAFLLTVLRGGCVGFVEPWFLLALGYYRIGTPLTYHVARQVGDIAGAILLVAVAIILPHVLEANGLSIWLPNCYCNNRCFRNGGVGWRVTHHWIFFLLGFLVDPKWLATQLKTPAATITFVVVVPAAILCLSETHIFHMSDIVVPYQESYVDRWLPYLFHQVAKQFYSVVFLAFLAPISYMGGIIPQGFAKLGQRTLHAYLINIFFRHLGPMNAFNTHFFMPFEHPETPRQIIICKIAVCLACSVACCPLTEWCVKWVTSPQWIFDGSYKVLTMLENVVKQEELQEAQTEEVQKA